eukprot:tig00020927_g15955.t1
MEERFVMSADLYDRLREYAHRSGERTLEDAVASLLDAAAGTAPAASCSEGSATAAASGPGAGKRRRTDPPPSASSQQETETAASGEPEAELAPIDQLPDDILSVIFERLGLQAAAAARAVCRRWRDAAAAVLWRRLDVKLSPERADELAGPLLGGQGVDWRWPDYSARAEIMWCLAARCHEGDSRTGGRWIRIAPGASLSLEITPPTDDAYSEAWRSTLSLLTAFSAAAGAASGGGGGLGEVDVDCSCAPYCCLADLLDALAPPGAAVCPSLRSLALRGGESCDPDCSFFYLGVDPVLRPLLFPNLESLSCRALCCFPGRPDAQALARCLPRLRRLEVEYDGEKTDIGGAAAVFPALEFLKATDVGNELADAATLLEDLVSGPAGATLTELVLEWAEGSAELTSEALRALERFPALQRIQADPYLIVFSDVGGHELAALGSLPALKSLESLHLCEEEGLAARLTGLATALERSSSLAELQLRIGTAPPREALPALARLAGAARGGLSLELEVDLAQSAGGLAEVAAALAPAPPRRLALQGDVDGTALQDGRLARLSAFAACSLEPIEVRLKDDVLEPRKTAWEAAAKALRGALPSVRIVRQVQAGEQP